MEGRPRGSKKREKKAREGKQSLVKGYKVKVEEGKRERERETETQGSSQVKSTCPELSQPSTSAH